MGPVTYPTLLTSCESMYTSTVASPFQLRVILLFAWKSDAVSTCVRFDKDALANTDVSEKWTETAFGCEIATVDETDRAVVRLLLAAIAASVDIESEIATASQAMIGSSILSYQRFNATERGQCFQRGQSRDTDSERVWWR